MGEARAGLNGRGSEKITTTTTTTTNLPQKKEKRKKIPTSTEVAGCSSISISVFTSLLPPSLLS